MLYPNQSPLIQAVNRLLESRNQNLEEVMQELQTALEHTPTQDERQQAAQYLVEGLRQESLARAQALFQSNPELFSDSDRGFFALLPQLQSQCLDSRTRPGDYQALADLRPLFLELPQCGTAEDVRAAAGEIRDYLAEHAPVRDAGSRRLLRTAEDELLASYLTLYPTLPSAGLPGLQRLSLLAAIENCSNPAYALDLLWLSNGLFTCLTPEELLVEPDVEQLAGKLAAVYRVCRRMPWEQAAEYLAQLQELLPTAILRLLNTDTRNLQPWTDETDAALDCLQELFSWAPSDELDAVDVPPEDANDVLQALSCMETLGIAPDGEVVRKTWNALREHLDGCPCCAESLVPNIIRVLMEKLLKEILSDEVVAVSPHLSCLMRLYLAMGMCPGNPGQAEELLAWVTGREAAYV